MHNQKNAVELGFIILYIRSNWFSFIHFSVFVSLSDDSDDRPCGIPPKNYAHAPAHVHKVWVLYLVYYYFPYFALGKPVRIEA